jgi:hypothetical protein
MFAFKQFSQSTTNIDLGWYAFDKTTWYVWVLHGLISVSNLNAIYSVNDALSFGGSGDKLLQVLTNEDTINPDYMRLIYLTSAGSSATPSTTLIKNFKIGNQGLFTVNGLSDDPQNNNIAYIYVTDSNINGGTFKVLKVDFSTDKYVSTPLMMGFGSSF